MHKTLLFCTISTFLCAAYSTDAQEYGWTMKAVEFEHTAFMADDPAEADRALIGKAVCLREAGMYPEAASTLDRVHMYLLPTELQVSVILEKAMCNCLMGDPGTAISILEQMSPIDPGFVEEVKALRAEFDSAHKTKKEGTAVALSFLPPLGQWYTGHYGEGLKSMAANAAAAGWTLWQCLSGCWISGLMGGGIALNETFFGNIESSAKFVDEFNETSRRILNENLQEVLKSRMELIQEPSISISPNHPCQ